MFLVTVHGDTDAIVTDKTDTVASALRCGIAWLNVYRGAVFDIRCEHGDVLVMGAHLNMTTGQLRALAATQRLDGMPGVEFVPIQFADDGSE